MSIPDFQSMMLPLLETIADGKEYSNRQVAVLRAELMIDRGHGLFCRRIGPLSSFVQSMKTD
ncbi:MAG: hypothetical protein KKE86_03995 [Planctomycetes bacterium]|nr:hypothetical protein [Planctomycetota bacterium]MBU4398479.1 hypothetical protein [Planctomycetota bacterium]MCG2682885.1 hypothetical protein [Planctomycetales bacterium]